MEQFNGLSKRNNNKKAREYALRVSDSGIEYLEGFHAVEYMREQYEKISKETKDMTFAELKQYYAEGSKQFRESMKVQV
ncbi:MAG: hypothetical protein LBF08_06010 [Dysgonamonadaceae bacterium]|jgi:hypothetical protein|nr:hypothetical protein [Dysgonamonadaceae bacterium]